MQYIIHHINFIKRNSLFFLLLMFISNAVSAQEIKEKEFRNKLTLAIGHAHPTEWINSTTGERETKVLPAWALDYDFLFNKKWSVGVHADVIVESFEVETFESKSITRDYPLAIGFVASRKFGDHLAIQLGPGVEYAAEESFALIRLGMDYGWEIRDNYELSVIGSYDYKIQGYQTFLIGLGVSRLW